MKTATSPSFPDHEDVASRGESPRVLVLASTGGTNDARIAKQISSLRDAGWEVTLFARSQDGLPCDEQQRDLQIYRLDCFGAKSLNLDYLQDLDFLGDAYGKLVNSTMKLVMFKDTERQLRSKSVLVQLAMEVANSKLRDWFPSNLGRRRSRVARLIHKCLAVFVQWRMASRADTAIGARVSSIKKSVGRESVAELMFYARFGLYYLNLRRKYPSGQFDVVHCHDIYPLPAAVEVARSCGAKLIFDAHEIEVERMPPMSGEKRLFIDQLERECLCYVDHLITVSTSCAEFYTKRFSRGPTSVVMNVPLLASFDSPGLCVRQRAGLQEGVPLIVYTGNVGREYRGLDKVVRALRNIERFHLVVLGSRQVNDDRWLMEIASQESVADRVHLLPPVLPEQVVPAIRSADVAVCPIQDASLSYRYSMPNKLFEAAAARLPIAVSDLPDMRSFVEELGIGLPMDQRDPTSIASTIEALYNDRDRYKDNETREVLLRTKYSWAAQERALRSIYDELGRAKHHGAP